MSAPAVSQATASQSVAVQHTLPAESVHPSKLVIAGMVLAFVLLLVGAIRLSPADTSRCDYGCGGASSSWFGASFRVTPG